MSTMVGRIPQKKWSSPHSQQKSLKCSTWLQSQKWEDDLHLFPRQIIQQHSNPSLCPNHWLWSWTFYEDLQDIIKLTPKNYVLFIIGDWKAKAGSQEIPDISSKFGPGVQNEAGQKLTRVLPREHTNHSKYPLPKHKRWLYTWTSPHS